MSQRQRRRPLEEHARLGAELYEQKIKPMVSEDNRGRIVAIDVDSGTFELGETTLEACERLYERCPDAQPWCVRIGYRSVHGFRGRSEVLE